MRDDELLRALVRIPDGNVAPLLVLRGGAARPVPVTLQRAGIFARLLVRAAAMLRIDLLGAAAGIALIALLPDSTVALWIGTIVLGMSIASMIPSSINYAGERMPITGQITALFLIGGSAGSTVLPLIVGRLYGDEPNVRPETMVWVTAAAVGAAILLLAAMAAATRRKRPEVGIAA